MIRRGNRISPSGQFTIGIEVAGTHIPSAIITNASNISSNDTDINLLQISSGILKTSIESNNTSIGNNTTAIGNNDTDINLLQISSGILKTNIESNDTEIAALNAVSGTIPANAYLKDETLTPASSGIYSVGTTSFKFSDIHSDSGHYTSGIVVGHSLMSATAIDLQSTSAENAIDILNVGDATAIDIIKQTGSKPVINIVNSGTGDDIDGMNFNLTKGGHLLAVSGVFTTGASVGGEDVLTTSDIGKYTATIDSGNWVADGGKFRYDVNHALADRFVVAQFYNISTFDNVLVDHYTLTDTNNIRVWSSTSGSLGVIIKK